MALGLHGENHQLARLTWRDVEAIRRLHEMGVSYSVLAQAYDVKPRTIGAICRFERWVTPDFMDK